MKAAKEAVPEDTERIRKRVKRLAALRRINDDDCTYITTRLDEIDARVEIMDEAGFNRREF